jgi:hypothetical protein
VSDPIEHSRALRLSARASGKTLESLRGHMDATTILLSAEVDLAGAVDTLGVLASTLRRMPGRLTLDPTGLADHDVEAIVAAAAAIDPHRGIMITGSPPPCDVHLHIGMRAGHGAVRAIPHRHGGHLLIDPAVQIAPPADVSGLGVVFTASVATAEAFKTLAAVVPARRRSPAHIAFCPVTLGPDPARSPLLATREVDLALIGVGAIGTAVVLILSLLPISGRLLAVDPQIYAPENLGTYSLGTLVDTSAQLQKTALAQRALLHWNVEPFNREVAELVLAVDNGKVCWPTTTIAALDDVRPRHDAQLLWPDLLIDAGTGHTSVGMHELRPWGPCEMCVFPTRRDGPSAVDRLAEATGLDPVYLAVDGLLDAAAVAQLPDERQERLHPWIGSPRCSLAQALGLTALDSDGYQPAAPFIAQQAACLAVGRLVAHLAGAGTTVTQFQYDVLMGPDLAHAERLAPRSNCYCQQHGDRIERVRSGRQRLRSDSCSGPNGRSLVEERE